MWRPEGVRFQSVDKSWKGDSSGAAKIEASGTSVAASDCPASPGPRH